MPSSLPALRQTRSLALVTQIALALVWLGVSAHAAEGASFTLDGPIPITGSEPGNSGVVGSVDPVPFPISLGTPDLTDGVVDLVNQDVFLVTITLAPGSAPVDALGMSVASSPLVPNPVGAGTFVGDAGQPPDTVTVIFPSTPDGDPGVRAGKPGLSVSSDQESPPSVDLKIPEPSPPLHRRHGRRYTSHNVA